MSSKKISGRENDSHASPASSNATPMRLLYMERAFKLPSLTGREVSRVNDLPAFAVDEQKRKKEKYMKRDSKKNDLTRKINRQKKECEFDHQNE